MSDPREWTKEEIRQQVMAHARRLAVHWATTDLSKPEFVRAGMNTVQGRIEGAFHSLLAMFDGCSGLPGFLIIPAPHPSDKDYNRTEGNNWYPEPPDVPMCDIGGSLRYFANKDGQPPR